MSLYPRNADLRTRILCRLAEAAPNGLALTRLAALTNRTNAEVSAELAKLIEAGPTYRRTIRMASVYFANEADAMAFDVEASRKAYSRRMADIAAFCGSKRLGATPAEIREAMGLSRVICAQICADMIGKFKTLVRVGPPMWGRYFADSEQAEAASAGVSLLIDAERAKAVEVRRARDRARYDAKLAIAGKVKRVKKPKPVKAIKAKPKAADKKQAPLPQGPVLNPKNIQPTVVPGFTEGRGRFDVTHAPPLFSLVGIGRDIETGRAWGKQ